MRQDLSLTQASLFFFQRVHVGCKVDPSSVPCSLGHLRIFPKNGNEAVTVMEHGNVGHSLLVMAS